MSATSQRIEAIGGFVLFVVGLLFLANTMLGQGDVKKRVTQRLGQWQELQQLASQTSAGQEAALFEWLAEQGRPKLFKEWLASEWQGTEPEILSEEIELQGGLEIQTVDIQFDALLFTELFNFLERVEMMSEPPWRIRGLDLQADSSGHGRAKLTLVAVSAQN